MLALMKNGAPQTEVVASHFLTSAMWRAQPGVPYPSHIVSVSVGIWVRYGVFGLVTFSCPGTDRAAHLEGGYGRSDWR